MTKRQASLVAFSAVASVFGIAVGASDPPATAPAADQNSVNLGTEPVTTSVNPDGSSVASGGMYVPVQTFGPFGPTDAQNNPFSTSSITDTLIRDQQARTLTEAARNDPSYGSYLTASSSGYSNFFIRGIQTDAPTNNRIDGLPVVSDSGLLLQDYERVDIYKGLSALEYGFTLAGGLVNYVSKLPLDQPLNEVSVSYMNSSQFTGAADISHRFGPQDAFGVRVNLAGTDGTGPINDTTNRNYVGALAADWRVVQGTDAWVNVSYSKNGYYGMQPPVILAGRPAPSPPDASDFFGVPFSHHIGTTRGLEGGVVSEITPWLSAHLTVGDFLATRDVAGDAAVLTDDTGDFRTAVTPHNLWSIHDRSGEFTLTARFDLGFIKSRTDVGVTGNDEKTEEHNIQSIRFLVGNSNLYDPTQYQNPDVPYVAGPFNDNWSAYRNFIARETVDLGQYFSLIGSVAHSSVRNSDNSSAADTVSENATTPTGAIIFKPIPQISIYGSFTEGLQPGAQASSEYGVAPVVNPGADLPPFVAKQYEVGSKYAVTDGLQANVALFRITQPSAIYEPTDASATEYVFTSNGEQVNKGLEVSSVGKVTQDLSIFAGVTFLNATITHSQEGTLDGKRAFGIPNFQGSLFAEYSIPGIKGLSALGGVYYTSMKYVDSANDSSIAGYTTFDLGGKYVTAVTAQPLTLRFYVQNLTNKNYWTANVFSPVLTLGDPRSYRVDVSIQLF